MIQDKWFKVRLEAKNPKVGEARVDYSFVRGENKFFVKFDLEEELGDDYIIKVKPIHFEQMIKEISNDIEH